MAKQRPYAKDYSQHSTQYTYRASQFGFTFIIGRLFSLLFTCLGKILDALLFTRHTFGENIGLFQQMLTVPTRAIGKLVGFVVQAIFELPSNLGHYVIDKPLAWLFSGYSNFGELSWVKKCNCSKPMQMPAGFLLGLIPAVTRYIIYNVIVLPDTLIAMTTELVCDAIALAYNTVSNFALRIASAFIGGSQKKPPPPPKNGDPCQNQRDDGPQFSYNEDGSFDVVFSNKRQNVMHKHNPEGHKTVKINPKQSLANTTTSLKKMLNVKPRDTNSKIPTWNDPNNAYSIPSQSQATSIDTQTEQKNSPSLNLNAVNG